MADDPELRRLLELVQARLLATESKPGITVTQVFEAYERACKDRHSWRMTADKLRPMVRRLGSVAAIEITPKAWAKHRDTRRGEVIEAGKSKGKSPSEATLRVELGVAKAMLEWAASDEQELIPFNPLRSAKYDRGPKRRRSWMPPDVFDRLIASPKPDGIEQRAVFHGWALLAYETGLRYEEARNARIDRLRRTEDGVALDVDTTKGGEPHTVGLTARALAGLQAIPRVIGSPYFFARSETKKLYGNRIFGYWFRCACEAANLDVHVNPGDRQWRPHDLRRGAATNAVDRGADIRQVQQMLHHASVKQTEDYVQRSAPEAIRLARIMERYGPHASTPVEKKVPSGEISQVPERMSKSPT